METGGHPNTSDAGGRLGYALSEPLGGLDFFISYAKSDEGWAVWIAWQLKEAGYSVLIQAWLVPGEHWHTLMEQGIREAKHVITVLSTAYSKSDYCRHEYQAAFRGDVKGASRLLIPIRVEACQPPGFLDGVGGRPE